MLIVCGLVLGIRCCGHIWGLESDVVAIFGALQDLSSVKYAAIHPSDKKKVVYVIYYSQIGIL